MKWLAEHQDETGCWDCDGFMKHDPAHDRCGGAGKPHYDTAVTGLALLAFLGAGYTDYSPRHARTIRQGLRHLIGIQDKTGCFGRKTHRRFLYDHAIATLAMCEAYWMTRNPRYRRPAQKGLDFIARARNRHLAWRYDPGGGDNDTSVTAWMVMALKSGKFAGLRIDVGAFEGAARWIDAVTEPNFGQAGYRSRGGAVARPSGLDDAFPREKSQAMTAAAIFTRIMIGDDPRSDAVDKGAWLCVETPPRWDPEDGSIDMYYWYYGSLALFQVGGAAWRKWNTHMKRVLLANQHPENGGARAGSWDPIGVWGPDGGRVYATACMVMCLEVYYRYDRVFYGPRGRRSGPFSD